MTRRYLLDTNIVSDLVYDPQGRTARKIAEVGADAVATSLIVASELRFGAAKKRAPRLTSQLDEILKGLRVLSLEPPVDRTYAKVRAALEALGASIGANDLFIAAHALALNMILVTDNEREFRRVPGLKVENWLKG